MKKTTLKVMSLMLVMTIISVALVSGTFAKYTTTITGGDTATAKTFVFDVNNATENEFATDLLPEKFVPGDTGSFQLALNNGSEINAAIEFAATITGTAPITYTVTIGTEDAPAYEIAGADLQAALNTLIPATGMTPGQETTVTVYWGWLENDATDINFQGTQYSLDIGVTASQIVND